MLFNSYEFILLFLPICLAGYAMAGCFRLRWLSISWLVVCSIYYYAWWNAPQSDGWTPRFLFTMLSSVAANYLLGSALLSDRPASRRRGVRMLLLAAGVGFNFGLLVYFKYTGFFIATASSLLGRNWPLPDVILPLAFSFHTFQQHAYLVDAYRRN